MEINQNKEKIQRIAQKKVEENNGKGLLAMCTGSGKSKVAINYCKDHKPKKVLLVVPTVKLRDNNWEEEFKKWNALTIYNKMERACYVSINKLEGKNYDLVILDEAHSITMANSEFFKQNKVKDIIGLAPTIPRDQEKLDLLNEIDCKVVFHYPLHQGVEDGVVAPYQINIIEIPLNATKKNIEAGNAKKRFFTTEYHNYKYLNKLVAQAIASKNKDRQKFAFLTRMRFISNLKSKTEFAKKLISSLDSDQRTIIFAGSIDQAEEVCQYTFHSKTNDKDYVRFKNEEINQLSCVKALNEGQNISNLDNGIIIQLDSNSLNLIQRIGRLVRYRDDHLAQIYILLAQGTQDISWAKSALSAFDKSFIRYIHYQTILNKTKNYEKV